MIHHISQCDPVIYEIDAEEEKLFQKEVEAIFENSNLLSEQNLDRLNEVGKSFMSVDWWGEFDDLLQGNSELACEIRSSFRSDDGDSEAPITNEEMDEFVEYIHTYGV